MNAYEKQALGLSDKVKADKKDAKEDRERLYTLSAVIKARNTLERQLARTKQQGLRLQLAKSIDGLRIFEDNIIA